MNKLITIRGALMTLAGFAASFLAIHIGLCIMFWKCGVMPMAYFNLFSIAFYVFSFSNSLEVWCS